MDDQANAADGAELEVLRAGIRLMAMRVLGDPDAADEIAQDSLVRAFHALRQSRPDRIGPFVAGIARHVIADVLRARARPRRLDELSPDAEPQEFTDPVVELCRAEEKASVRTALLQLSPEDQRLLHLVYFQELTPGAIARQLGEPAERIRQRKTRALARLRRAFLESASGPARHDSRTGATTHGEMTNQRTTLEAG